MADALAMITFLKSTSFLSRPDESLEVLLLRRNRFFRGLKLDLGFALSEVT